MKITKLGPSSGRHPTRSKKFWLVIAAALAIISMGVVAAPSQPSAEEIDQWLAIAENTKDLILTDYSHKAPNSPVDWERQNARQDALRHLGESRAGTRALMAYYLKKSSVGFTPDLSEVAGDVCVGIRAGFKEDPNFIQASELRPFLLSAARLPYSAGLDQIVEFLPFEHLVALRDVWLAWLEAVRGDRLSISDIMPVHKPRCALPPPDGSLVIGACNALGWSADPAGVPLVLKILKETPRGVPRWYVAYAMRYLNKMGDDSAFGTMLRFVETEPCNDGVWAYLGVANESQAKALYDAFHNDAKRPCMETFPIGNSENRVRPDLSRGILPFYLHDPVLRGRWKSGQVGSQFFDIFGLGEAALRDEDILEEAKRAETEGNTKLQAFWIGLLGRRDSKTGNEELARWALQGAEKGMDPLEVPSAAKRALFRRLLGHSSSEILTLLNSRTAENKRRLITLILGGSGWFPDLAPPQLLCGVGMDADWEKIPPPEAQSTVPLLTAYQDKLLPLMDQLGEPEKLVSAYAVMTSPQARRKFLGLLENGNPLAIQLAWTLNLNAPPELLRRLLGQPGLAAASRMFIQLRLSEMGDGEAYESLKQNFLSSFGQPNDELSRFRSAILDEIERRGDMDTLVTAIERSKSKQGALSTTPKELLPLDYRDGAALSPAAPLLSRLVRLDPAKAFPYLNEVDLAELRGQLFLLQIAVMASSPKAEMLLKSLEKESRGWPTRSSTEIEASRVMALWKYALRVTNTPWCRDRLAELKDWDALAQLGDPRGGMPSCECGGNGSLDAFLVGNIQQAIACMRKRHASDRYPPFFIARSENALPIPKWYDHRRVEPIMKDFMAMFPSLCVNDRMVALSLLPSDVECWPDNLCVLLLRDSFAPVRLTVLLYLLEHPRHNLREEMRRVEASDPMPWCRRLAHEILLFKPDPLQVTSGIRFALPWP
jgi:hypothetical protein